MSLIEHLSKEKSVRTLGTKNACRLTIKRKYLGEIMRKVTG